MEITVEMVERLREKAPVSYAQAKEALEYSEGNLLDALIYLEEKGAIPQAEGTRWSGREEKESQPTAAELVVQETPEPGKKKKHRSPLGVVVVGPKGEKRRGRSLRELLARIRAALRKRGSGERPEEPLLSAGPLTMDVERHTVAVSGTPVELTRREFDLLHHLLENKGRVLSREALLDSVWGFDFVGETNSVDVYIRFLRSKIDEAFDIKLIHTVRGVGYVIREE